MNKKLTVLYAFALVFACSPAFAEDSAQKAAQPAKTESKDSVSPAPKKTAEKASKPKTEKAALRKVAKEEEGKDAVCAVTGEKFKVTAETLSASYKGKVYYFCCPGCGKPFIANPEKYLNKKKGAQTKMSCPDGEHKGDKPAK